MKKKFVTRAYNKIIYNENNLSIIKTSNNKKLKNEINYLSKIPTSLKRYFPYILEGNKKNNNKNFRLELEFIPYDNLGTIMINNKFNKRFWLNVAKSINIVLEDFNSKSLTKNFDLDQIKMYINKTENEYLKFKSSSNINYNLCAADNITLNGKRILNFEIIWPQIKKKILKNYLNNKISFIHGDFCFSNILFKNIGEKTSVKLIDPRGSFGKFLNMGDMYYDLAKLRHSLNGAYEYIIYDKFKIQSKKFNYILKMPDNNYKKILKIFDDYVFLKYKYEKIKIIEGAIFIGMCARHYDSTKRQTSMYLTGLKNLNEVI